MLFWCSFLLISGAQAANLAELIQSRSGTLSRAAAAIPQNPQWSQPGPFTLFVPTDAALATANLPSGSLGKVLISGALDYKTATFYQILKDLDSNAMIVYDNYTPGNRPDPEIHCRFATGEALTIEQVQADNGWLYVLNAAVAPPPLPLDAIKAVGPVASRGSTQFVEAVTKAGLESWVNNLTNSTIFMPMDSAFTGVNVASFSENQLKAIILNHVVPQTLYSTLMNAGSYPSSLQGQSISIASAGEGVTVSGARVALADTFMSGNGVIHIIDRVLVPASFPENVVVPNNTPATTTGTPTTTSGSGSGSGSSASARPLPKNSAQTVTGWTSVLMGLLGLLAL